MEIHSICKVQTSLNALVVKVHFTFANEEHYSDGFLDGNDYIPWSVTCARFSDPHNVKGKLKAAVKSFLSNSKTGT